MLFRQGDRGYDFFVVLAGKVAVRDGDGPAARLVAVHGAGRFLGELSLLTGQAAFFTAEVIEPGEVLVVPVERLRERALLDPALGDLILRAYVLRREFLIGLGAGLKIVGSRFSPDARRLREFTARNRLPHRWIDVEEDPEAEALLHRLGVAPDETPIVIWAGQVMRNPSSAELARAIGLKLPRAPVTTVDLVVVGAGPAGIAAAVYGASEGLATVVLDAVAVGGQAATTSRIENYLGFPSGISGPELAERGTIQAEKFGAEINVPCATTGLEQRDGQYVVRYDDARQVSTRALLIATGARYRKLDVPRLEDFEGAGVYYAATQMEAMLCRGDPVAVVGGGNSAGQATLFMSRQAPMVRLVIRHDDLARDMSRYLVDRIARTPQRRGPGLHRGSRTRRRQRARGAGRGGPAHRRATQDRGARAVRVHRRRPAHGLARRTGRARRDRVHPHRLERRAARRAGSRAVDARDQPARRVRGGRRAQRIGQARGLRRRRGRDGRAARARPPPSAPPARRGLIPRLGGLSNASHECVPRQGADR